MKKYFLIILSLLSFFTGFSQSVKISDMPAATTTSGTEIAPIVQSGTNKKATLSLIRGWSSLGTANQLLKVNAGATALEFFTPTYISSYPGAGIALSTGSAWGASITDNSTNWNTAFGWGNHASAGYMTLSGTQTNSGTKTFLDGSFKLRNVANTFDAIFSNTNTANRTYTLPNFSGNVLVSNGINTMSGITTLDGDGTGEIFASDFTTISLQAGLNTLDLGSGGVTIQSESDINLYPFTGSSVLFGGGFAVSDVGSAFFNLPPTINTSIKFVDILLSPPSSPSVGEIWFDGSFRAFLGTTHTFATTTAIQTLTNKTFALGSNTFSGTKAQFNTAVTDGDILYVGDITQYTDELAQDAVGAMVDASLTYVDGTPLLQRAALTGDVTASAGSNSTTIAAGAVDIAMLSATGTPSGSTYLRGDNTWASVSGSGDMVLATAQTSTGKKTFQSDATNAGINLGSGTADPSSLTTGDLWVSSANSIKERNNGITAWAMSATALPTDTYIPFGTNTGVFSQSSSLTWNGTTLNATQFNGVTLVTGGTATKYLSEDGTYTTPSGGSGLTYAQVKAVSMKIR